LKKISVLFFVLLALLSYEVEAQEMCPSKTTYIKIFAFNDAGDVVGVSSLHIAPRLLPGTDPDCPNRDVVAEISERDHKNQAATTMPVLISRGAVSDPSNILSEEEAKALHKTPPKQEEKKQDTNPVPMKGQTTADAKANTLRSSIN
jgi:hypothetical protein